MNKNAFSLIELLVVVFIVGLLGSILLPAFGKAKEGAKVAHCASNLRDIGLGWFFYLDDHEERFPSENECNFATFGGKGGSIGEGYDVWEDVDDDPSDGNDPSKCVYFGS